MNGSPKTMSNFLNLFNISFHDFSSCLETLITDEHGREQKRYEQYYKLFGDITTSPASTSQFKSSCSLTINPPRLFKSLTLPGSVDTLKGLEILRLLARIKFINLQNRVSSETCKGKFFPYVKSLTSDGTSYYELYFRSLLLDECKLKTHFVRSFLGFKLFLLFRYIRTANYIPILWVLSILGFIIGNWDNVEKFMKSIGNLSWYIL